MKTRTTCMAMLLTASSLLGCQDQFGLSLGGSGSGTDSVSDGSPMPPGATCASTRDCDSGRACVEHRCRPLTTSVAGEILATLAAEQLESGDGQGASATYAEALQAFETSGAAATPAVLCGAADAMMQAARGPEARETAARMADRCFRGSLPGDPSRASIQKTLGELRYDGLWLAAFDEASPAAQYFTARPARPSADSVDVDIQLPDNNAASFEEIAQKIRSAELARAVADCFIQDWELRHESSASASFQLDYRVRMRDMGDYDAYLGTATVSALGGAADGFEPCVGAALESTLGSEPSRARGGSWNETVRIQATLRR